jgi:hypothetical protein
MAVFARIKSAQAAPAPAALARRAIRSAIGPALAGRKLSSGMLIAATRTLRVSLAVLPVQVGCVSRSQAMTQT